MSAPLTHLTASAVRAIHEEVLAAHGGLPGIREEGLLESAVAAPEATMMGEALITEPVEVAAAYLFYICRNHAFIDGNKRTALAACLVFSMRTAGFPGESSRPVSGNRSCSMWPGAISTATKRRHVCGTC